MRNQVDLNPCEVPDLRSAILNDPSKVLLLRDALIRKAAEARSDPKKFFEFVMREETTRKRIKIANHQKVIIDFVMAHEKSVLMIPAGHSKTFSLAGLYLYLLGRDPSSRGVIISETQGQSEKPVGMVRDYIETSQELRLVFPGLQKSMRKADPWTQTHITVDRPAGIRDASLFAGCFHGSLSGSRLNYVVVDDILSPENTKTKPARDDCYEWLDGVAFSRLDPVNAKVVIANTAWHPDDVPHRLKKLGWPTLIMNIYGQIFIHNTDFDSEDLRPEHPTSLTCRLSAFPDNNVPLFPERFTNETIEKLVKTHLPHRFKQLYCNDPRDDGSARCKQEWIDKCKEKGKGYSLVSKYEGSNLTVTGVDLAVSQSDASDDTAFFTFEVLPTGERRILDIEIGKFDGPTIVDKLFEKQAAYQSFLRVENNAAQDFILQFARKRDISIPLSAHRTGREKAHPELGIEGLFIELSNGAWIIPCNHYGECHPSVQRWIDSCLYYSPNKHTPDELMACYFGREEAKRFGSVADNSTGQGGAGLGGLMTR